MQSNPGASISSNKELKSKGLLSMMLSLPEDWNIIIIEKFEFTL